MGKDLLYAGGYARPWKSDAEEITASRQASGWHPATVDFKATVDASGGGAAVSSLIDILAYLRNKSEGSVDELTIVAHAADGIFSLGGQIIPPQGKTPGNVKFTSGNYINADVLSANATQIAAVKGRFSEKAKIILVGCDAGMGATLLNQFAKAFGVCVLGFSDKVWTGFVVAPSNPPNPPAIASRGHIYVDSSGLMSAGMAPGVLTWTKDVSNLKTDRKSDNCP